MEIKTCEQYVLDQLEQAQDEAEELRGKLMERGEVCEKCRDEIDYSNVREEQK